MAKTNKPKLCESKGTGIENVFLDSADNMRLDGIYTIKGLSRVDQKHDTRINLLLPAQLLEVFGGIAEEKYGARGRTAVIEHLMIEYCRENGARIGE